MKKLLIPAMGVAAALGAAQPAAADVQTAQLMIQGQPGYTGTVNRTTTPGSAGIAPMNTPVGPSPYSVAPSPSFAQPSPFIGQRGDLNAAAPEVVSPGEPDASGKLNPTVDRQRARFAGERGSDGKLLPTYGQQAQATSPSQTTPQAAPATPSRSDMPQNQPSQTNTKPGSSSQPGTTTRRPGSGAADTTQGQPSVPAPHGQNQMGTMGNSPQPTGSATGSTATGQNGTTGSATTNRSRTMGSGATSQSDTSTQGTQQRRMHRDRMHSQSQGDKSMKSSKTGSKSTNANESSETAALNALSAEGYTNVGKIERVGGNWQTTAMKDGRQVTVQVNPQTNQVTTR